MAEEEGKAVLWPNGAEEVENIADFEFFMAGRKDQPVMKIEKEKLNEFIVVNGEGVKAVAGGATSASPTILRPGPTGANRKMEDVQGWFVNGTAAEPPVATGSPWEAPAGKKNTNWWDGTTWSLGSSVPLPTVDTTDLVKNEDINLVYGNQLFDGIKIAGSYINNSGVLLPNANGSYGLVDLTNKGTNTSITVNKVPASTGVSKYYSFQNASNTVLSFGRLDPAEPKTLSIPGGATKFLFTIDVSGSVIDASKIMTNYGTVPLEWEPYTPIVDAIKGNPTKYPVYSKRTVQTNNLVSDNIETFALLITSTGYLAKSESSNWNVAWKVPTNSKPTIYIKGLNTSAASFISFFTGPVPTESTFTTGQYDSVFLSKVNFTKTNGAATVAIPTTATWFAINIKNATEDVSVYSNLFISYTPIDDNEPVKKDEFISKVDNQKLASEAILNGDKVILAGDIALKSEVNQGVVLSFSGENAVLNYNLKGKKVSQSFAYNRALSVSNSNTFDFRVTTVDGDILMNEVDGCAPYNCLGTTIGGNHGFAKTILTVVTHNKTVQDIGSVWSVNGLESVLTRIVSSTQVEFSARNSNSGSTAGDITHISGATNTSTMTATAATTDQLYPSIKERKCRIFVDGVEIFDTNKQYTYSNNLVFLETYDLMEKSDMMNWLISKVGTFTDSLFKYDTAPSTIKVSVSYVIDTKGACTIYTDFLDIKGTNTELSRLMFIMANAPVGQFEYYVPTAIPFVYNGLNLDFANKVPLSSIVWSSSRIDFGVSRLQSTGLYGDRLIFKRGNIGMAMGYLPIQDADISKRRTMAPVLPIQISTTKKVYMHGLNTPTVTSSKKGDYYSVVAYKNLFVNTGDETCYYISETNSSFILYLDIHKQGVFSFELDERVFGKVWDIVDKTSNISVLNKENNGRMTVETTDANRSYLVARFDK